MANLRNLDNQFAVITLPLGPIYTNSHIFVQTQKPNHMQKALIIDAPLDSLTAICEVLREYALEPQALLLTHGHWDHMGGADILARELGLQIWAGIGDALLLQNPQIMSTFAGDFNLAPVEVDHWLQLEFSLEPGRQPERAKTKQVKTKSMPLQLESWPELEIMAFSMPGHTPGGVAYYFPQANCVMSGDQLFQGSVGRSDFPGGDFSLLQASIRESLYSLPGQTVVFSGHGEETRIDTEIQTNPFVRA